MTSKPSYEDLEQRIAALEKQLETTEHFYTNILNSIPDIIFVKDDSHRWTLLMTPLAKFSATIGTN